MIIIHPQEKLQTNIDIPSDKSISHRSLIIGAIANGKTVINNFLDSEDTKATLNCLTKLNVKISWNKKTKQVILIGTGKYLSVKKVLLNAAESGTTIRILTGILCAQKFSSTIKASPSLMNRPMLRITEPLRKMKADISGVKNQDNEFAPLRINPVKELSAITYSMPIASAQLKSAILLAGLYAKGQTIIKQPYISRDHTERMLKLFKAKINSKGKTVKIKNSTLTSPKKPIFIPGDISSAAFFMALGILLKNSKITLRKVSLNPTRIGIIKVLKKMGAKLSIFNKETDTFEPYGDITVESSKLQACKIEEKEIPLMIDEIPIIAVLASVAKGKTEILGLKELKVKETDRLKSMKYNLEEMGSKIEIKDYLDSKNQPNQKMIIQGIESLKGGQLRSFGDHRTAMSLIIAALSARSESVLDNHECISKSFPEFVSMIKTLLPNSI